MKQQEISIGDKEYTVKIAESEEERVNGLSNTESLPKDEGMLFLMPEGTKEATFNTVEMNYDIDIIFINEDNTVYDMATGKARSKDLIVSEPKDGEHTKYVLEVNKNSGIKIGDEFEILDDVSDEEVDKMYVIGSDGKPQMQLLGGERICSRKNTRILIHLAKKARKSKSESDYKHLGKMMFKYLRIQDNRDPEYVESPK